LVLKNGISIANVPFEFIKLEQLYIKLDKKLILRAKNISFKNTNNSTDSSLKDIDFASKELIGISKNLKYLYRFVQEVDIENLNINENHMRILFKNDEFFVDNNLLFLKLSLHRENENIKADIQKLILKDYELSVDGNLSINAKSEFYYFDGKAKSDLLDFTLNLSYKNAQLAYKVENLNIYKFAELFQRVQQRVSLNENLNLWLLKRIKADFYHFDYLQGFVDFKDDNYYLNTLEALAYAQNVALRLDENMQPIVFDRLDLNLSKQKLDFGFEKANYKNADLSQSRIYLYDLFDKNKIGLYLHIKSPNLQLDEGLFNALKQYINIPFYQKSGKMQSDFELKINFNQAKSNFYQGSFILENSLLSLADFNISKALVEFKQNDLNITNAELKNNFLEADFNATINLSSKQGLFDVKVQRLHFNEDIFDMKNQNFSLNLDYTNDILITIPQYNLDLNFQNGIVLNINNLSDLLIFSPLAQKFGLLSAKNLNYESFDFNDFKIRIEDMKIQGPFIKSDKSPYEEDSFEISKEKEVITIQSESNFINASLKDSILNLHLNNLIYTHKTQAGGDFTLENNRQNIVFGGANFGIVLSDFNKTLMFDRAELWLNADTLEAKAISGGANFEFFYTPSDLKLSAKNMSAQFLNTFLQKQAFEEGVFSFELNGGALDYFDGSFDFKNTYIKDLKGVNQLISFIDTVPSLILFKSPTFNEKGLHLENGKILFNRKKDLLSFQAITLKGDSVDVYGLGSANLRLDSLDLNLELRTLKSASEAISKVPILNYVILGKSQEISTNLKVDGSINDPKFHTQILSDTLKTPFNLIKNILQLPTNLLN